MSENNLDNIFLAQANQEDSPDAWLRDRAGRGGTSGSSAGMGKPDKAKSTGAPQPASSSGGSSGGDSSGQATATVADAPPSPNPNTLNQTARGIAFAVAKDVGYGLLETPEAVYDGAREAVQEGNRSAGLFFDWAYKNWQGLKRGALEATANTLAPMVGRDPAQVMSEYDAAWDPFGEVNKLFKAKYGRDMVPSDFNLIAPVMNALPDAEQETWTGAIVQGISQYLTGNAIMGPFAKAAGVPVNVWGQAVRDAFNGALFFDERMERLSNLLPEGPVRDFMIADPAGEEIALNKLKMAMEGGLIGAVAGATFESIKWGLRTLKAASRGMPMPRLVVARRMPDGTIREGKPGDMHPMLVDEDAGEQFDAATNEQMGFTIPGSGKFMTRAEATAWVKKHEPKIAAEGEARGLHNSWQGGYLESGAYQQIRQRIEEAKKLIAAGWKRKDAYRKQGIEEPENRYSWRQEDPSRLRREAEEFRQRQGDGEASSSDRAAHERLENSDHEFPTQENEFEGLQPGINSVELFDVDYKEVMDTFNAGEFTLVHQVSDPDMGAAKIIQSTRDERFYVLDTGVDGKTRIFRVEKTLVEHQLGQLHQPLRTPQKVMLDGVELTPHEIQNLTDEQLQRVEVFEHDGTHVIGESGAADDLSPEYVFDAEAPEGFSRLYEGPDGYFYTESEAMQQGLDHNTLRFVEVRDEMVTSGPNRENPLADYGEPPADPSMRAPAAGGGGGADVPPGGGGGGDGGIPPEGPPSTPEGGPSSSEQARMRAEADQQELRDLLDLHGGEDDFYLGLLHEDPRAIRQAVEQLKRQLAREANTPGEMVPISGRALKINLDRIKTAEDVKLLLADMEHLMGPMDDIPLSDVHKRAMEMHTGVRDYLEGKVDPAILSGGHQMRLRILLTSSAENLLDLARKAHALSGTKLDKAKFVKAFTIHRALQEFALTQQIGAERALGAWKLMARSDGEAMTQINEMLGTLGESNIDEMIEKMSQLESPTAISRMAKALEEETDRDIIQMIWYNLLLSSPDTQVANIAGTGLNSVWDIPERGLAAGLKYVPGVHRPSTAKGAMGAALGDRQVYLAEAKALLYGKINGLKNGFIMAGKAMKTGKSTFQGPGPIEGLGRTGFGAMKVVSAEAKAAQWLNALVPVNFMKGADDFFKWVNFSGEMNALALRYAYTMGKDEAWAKDLLRHPPQWMLQQAKRTALERTFNAPLQGFMQHFAKAMDEFVIPVPHLPNYKGIPAGRILMPFIRTPTNALKWSYDRSLAAYMPNSRIRRELQMGGATRDLAIAKMTMGHAMMLGFATWMMDGRIDGGGPQDPVLNAMWQNAGHVPYSIQFGDTRYKFDRFQPFADLLRWMADATETVEYALEDPDKADLIAQSVVFGLADALHNRTYFQSLGELFRAMDESQYEGTKFANRFVSSWNPAILKDVEHLIDPTIRQGRTMLDSLRSGIPGLSKDLPPNLNVWGEVQEQAGFQDGIAQLLLPSGSKKVDPMPIETFVWENRIRVEKPSIVQKWSQNGIEVEMELTGEQLNQLIRLQSRIIKDPQTNMNLVDTLNSLVSGKHPTLQTQWDSMSPHFQGEKVKAIIREFRAAAKKRFIVDNHLEGALMEAFERKAREVITPEIGGQ